MSNLTGPLDLNLINFQKQFIENAINHYTNEIIRQKRLITSTKLSGQIEKSLFFERNVCFLEYYLKQYQQLLSSLKHMWDVYSNNQKYNSTGFSFSSPTTRSSFL